MKNNKTKHSKEKQMRRCLRPLIGKIKLDKLTPEEWDMIAEQMHEYANNTATFCFVISFIIGVIVLYFVL